MVFSPLSQCLTGVSDAGERSKLFQLLLLDLTRFHFIPFLDGISTIIQYSTIGQNKYLQVIEYHSFFRTVNTAASKKIDAFC